MNRWIFSSALRIFLLSAYLLALGGCFDGSTIVSKRDLTESVRVLPLSGIHLHPQKDEETEAALYLIPSNKRNFYDFVRHSKEALADGKPAAAKVERVVGLTVLEEFIDTPLDSDTIKWFLVTREKYGDFGFDIGWLDLNRKTLNVRKLDVEQVRSSIAAIVCEKDLQHSEQPCKRFVNRYLYRHFSASTDGFDVRVSDTKGLTALLKFVFQNRADGKGDAVSSKPHQWEEWRFSELSANQVLDVRAGKRIVK